MGARGPSIVYAGEGTITQETQNEAHIKSTETKTKAIRRVVAGEPADDTPVIVSDMFLVAIETPLLPALSSSAYGAPTRCPHLVH